MTTETIGIRREAGVFSTGVALFSMFFGAGNLIFPLLIGKAAGVYAPLALLGLMVSAILFPLLGLMAMMLFDGDLDRFLKRLGPTAAFVLLLTLQLVQGPLCLSRLFSLMHASIKSYLPIDLLPFSILIAAVVFFIAYRSQRLMTLLGKVLTPFLLLSISVLVVAGLVISPEKAPIVPPEGATFHFFQGLKGGYMTMDLVAAILFATVILPHLAQGGSYATPEEKKFLMRKKMVGASIVAALLLMVAYLGLSLLSSQHGASIESSPQDLLQALAVKVLGVQGAFVAAIAVFLACLTTAVALAAVFASYLRTDLVREKISPNASLAVTVLLATLITNVGFERVLKMSGPLLEILYPALIVLCLMNIAHSRYQTKIVKAPVFIALGLGTLNFLLHH